MESDSAESNGLIIEEDQGVRFMLYGMTLSDGFGGTVWARPRTDRAAKLAVESCLCVLYIRRGWRAMNHRNNYRHSWFKIED